ncbi:MAG: hypothetical protein H6559_37385 [Lewinellaceae bacterium]|nr:hypothetical protein [Lewinellaceae bacterium]
MAGFSFDGGCDVTDNSASIPPGRFDCGAHFTYTATSGRRLPGHGFLQLPSVAAADDLTVECRPMLPACSALPTY